MDLTAALELQIALLAQVRCLFQTAQVMLMPLSAQSALYVLFLVVRNSLCLMDEVIAMQLRP